MSFSCTICNTNYKSYQSLWNHNNKFHENNVISNKKIVGEFKCPNCNKNFTRKNNMNNHMKTLCAKKQDKTTELEKKLIKLEEEMQTLKNKPINNTTTNNTTNTNNGTINNINITINKVGSENMSELSYKDAINIFDKKIESLVKFVQLLNFNEKIPSNHNFCTTSLDGQYLSVYNTDQSEQHKQRKKYFFEDLLCRSVNRMEQLYNRYKNKFTKEKQQQIEEDILTLKTIRDKDMNTTILREMLKKLNLLSYNYKETVLKTWDRNDIIGMKEKTFEEDLMESDEDIKDIENIFIKVENSFEEYDGSEDLVSSDTDSPSERPQLVIKKKSKNEIEV